MRQGVLLITLLLFAPAALAQMLGERITISEPFAGDLYAFGRSVALLAPVEGDATVAGMEVRVDAPVAQDLNVAAETLLLRAPVGDDLRAAARQVLLGADIRDHVVAAGQRIHLEPGVTIGSFAWLAGETIELSGDIGGELQAAGRVVIIAGSVGGDAIITAERVELRPGARIGGDLVWRSRTEPAIAEGAEVDGRVVGEPLPPRREPPIWGIVAAAMVAFLSLLVAGLVLYLLLPRVAESVAATVRERPGLSALIGFAILAATPLAILLLFVSAVGMLLGLILLALYLVAIPVGWLVGAYGAGEYLLRLIGKLATAGRGLRAGVFVLAMVMLAVIQALPILGWLIGLAVLVIGLGGIAVTGRRAYPHEA